MRQCVKFVHYHFDLNQSFINATIVIQLYYLNNAFQIPLIQLGNEC